MRDTFNISTAAAFIAAGAGLADRQARQPGDVGLGRRRRRARGARRAHRSDAGTGGRLPRRGRASASCSRSASIPAMRHVAAPRREIGVRTIFNLLGPLTNPAGAQAQLLGVFAREWVEPLAQALGRLGSRARAGRARRGRARRAVADRAEPGGRAARRRRAHLSHSIPTSVGLRRCQRDAICAGGDAARQCRDHPRTCSPARGTAAQMDIALLNAARGALRRRRWRDGIAAGVAAGARGGGERRRGRAGSTALDRVHQPMILDDIVSARRADVARAKARGAAGGAAGAPRATPQPRRGFRGGAARSGRPAVIAEVKKASPSQGRHPGRLRSGRASPARYAAAGAAAISVLTEERFFQGSPQHLAAIRAAVDAAAAAQGLPLRSLPARRGARLGRRRGAADRGDARRRAAARAARRGARARPRRARRGAHAPRRSTARSPPARR